MNKRILKTVSAVLDAPEPKRIGDGFLVSNFFPSGYKLQMSPFFLLDFNAKMELASSLEPKGIGVHPHRGFETVTIAYHGAVAHQDSAGNSGVIYPGDVQWMTAAKGILHKEYFEQEFSTRGGIFQMVQLWINLPAKDKMAEPAYQAINNEEIGKYHLENDNGIIEIIAGTYKGIHGAAKTFSDLHLYNARVNEGAEFVLIFPAHYNTGIMIIEGSIIINEITIGQENQFVQFSNNGEEIHIKACTKSVILILSGAPLNEPVVQYGPFVMNTKEEIEQALNDYNNGVFGYLEE
jgi:redox-sensitive bicupin YhaK (pirin superfamily)